MNEEAVKEFIPRIVQPESRYLLQGGLVGKWTRNLEAHIRLHQIDPSSDGCHVISPGSDGKVLIVDNTCLYEIEYVLAEGEYVFSSMAFPLNDLKAVAVSSDSKIAEGFEAGKVTSPSIRLTFSAGQVEIPRDKNSAKQVTALLPRIWEAMKRED